jgi:hypothetical protein
MYSVIDEERILDLLDSHRDQDGIINDIKGASEFISGFVYGSVDMYSFLSKKLKGKDVSKTDINVVLT